MSASSTSLLTDAMRVRWLVRGVCFGEQVCTLAGESVNPRRDVPISIAITLGIVSVTYVLAATALAGMVPLSGQSGDEFSFVFAFAQRGWHWAAEVRGSPRVSSVIGRWVGRGASRAELVC